MSKTFLNCYNLLEEYENIHAKWCAELIANGRKTLQSISNSIDNDLLVNLMDSFMSFVSLLAQCQPNSLSNKTSTFKPSDKTLNQKNESQDLLLKNDIIKMVNSDLQCPICNEWLFKATSANCNHTFCETCIKKWLKINKTCPVCRTSVQFVSTSIAVDNFITNLCHLFGGFTKERRESIVNARIDHNKNKTIAHLTLDELINDSNDNQSIEDDTFISQHDTTIAMSHPNRVELIYDSNINQSIEDDTFISQHDTTIAMSHPNMVRLIPCPPTPTFRRNSRRPIVTPNIPHPNTVQLLPFPQPSTSSASSLTCSNHL